METVYVLSVGVGLNKPTVVFVGTLDRCEHLAAQWSSRFDSKRVEEATHVWYECKEYNSSFYFALIEPFAIGDERVFNEAIFASSTL